MAQHSSKSKHTKKRFSLFRSSCPPPRPHLPTSAPFPSLPHPNPDPLTLSVVALKKLKILSYGLTGSILEVYMSWNNRRLIFSRAKSHRV